MISRALRFLRNRFRRAFRIYAVIFFRSPPPSDRAPFDGKLIEVDHEQFDKWVWTIHYFPWPNPKVSHSRLDDKTKLYALLVGDKPVCLGWVSEVSSFPVDELNGKRCYFDPASHLIWDCVTLADERRKGYFTKFLVALQAKFPSVTFSIFCHPDNLASAGAITKAGFRRWCLVRSTRVGDRIRVFDSGKGTVTFEGVSPKP
jgi:hypothetical protein